MANAGKEVSPLPVVLVPSSLSEAVDRFSPLVDHDANAIQRRRMRECVGVVNKHTQTT